MSDRKIGPSLSRPWKFGGWDNAKSSRPPWQFGAFHYGSRDVTGMGDFIVVRWEHCESRIGYCGDIDRFPTLELAEIEFRYHLTEAEVEARGETRYPVAGVYIYHLDEYIMHKGQHLPESLPGCRW